MKTSNKNRTIKTKVLSAVAMLSVSAVLLTTASYAWFTMNKRVTVDNIQVTASVPESLEISLGKVDANGLATDPTDTADWNNLVNFGTTYDTHGNLIPVSSVDGVNMFFTNKAQSGSGKPTDDTAFQDKTTGGALALYQEGKTGTTAADAYYLDIPVWVRTRGATDADLGLRATVTGETGENLYKSVRVAILNEDKTEGFKPLAAKGFAADGTANDKTIWSAGAYFASDNTADQTKAQAVSGIAAGSFALPNLMTATVALTADDSVADTAQSPAASVVLAVPGAATDALAGTAQKFTVRIWFEGQDTECKDDNASQKSTIKLDFFKLGA